MLVSVSGVPHSGTTLVATIMGAHKDLHLIPRETNLFNISSVPSLEELHPQQYGKLGVVEKSPNHMYQIERIKKYFPDAKFIITIRDYRDVVASSLHNPVRTRETTYDNLVFLVLLYNYRKDILFIKYEDIVEDLEGQCRKMCEYIGLEFDPQMLEFHKKDHKWWDAEHKKMENGNDASIIEHRAWQVRQPLFDGRGRWRNELTPEALHYYRNVHKKYLETFGYEE